MHQQSLISANRNFDSGHSSRSSSFSEAAASAASPSAIDQCTDRYKTELCRSFEEGGTCRYGNKCRFAHGGSELRQLDRHPKYKTEFCRTYHTSGFCPYGQRCHFIHSNQGSPGTSSDSSTGSCLLPPPLVKPDGTKEPGLSSGADLKLGQWRMSVTRSELLQGFQDEQRLNNSRAESQLHEYLPEERLICLAQRLNEKRRKLIELERRSLGVNGPERNLPCQLEPKLLELELSAILQRRRTQLRCNSVGSSCGTPPLFVPALDSFAPSLASSPLSSGADENKSPNLPISPDISLSISPHVLRSKSPKSGHTFGRRVTTSIPIPCPSRLKGVIVSPSWSGSEGLAPRAAAEFASPNRRMVFSDSSFGHRGTGPYFLFDAETLAQLIH